MPRPPLTSRAARSFAARAAAAASRAARAAASRGLTSKYYTGAYVKRSNNKMKRAIARVVNMNKETCFLDYSYGKSELYHNTYSTGTCLYPLNDSTRMPAQGDGDSQRTGNVIQTLNMQIRVMVLLKGDRVNAKVRFLVLSFPKGVVPSTTGSFLDAVTGNNHIDPVDKGRCQVHKDVHIGYKNVNPGGGVAVKEITIFRKFTIPFKRRITFYDDGTQDNNCTRDYYAIAIAYDSYGSLISDNIAAIQLWRRLSWKDI